MTRVCECCGQPMPETRFGVRLTPLKARIFDAIQRAGRDGILGDDLFDIALRERGVKRATLKEHIHQLNRAFEHTEIRIAGRRTYRLETFGRAPLFKSSFTLACEGAA